MSLLTKAMRDDGWLDWEGGECPVHPMTQVGILYGSGKLKNPALFPAGSYDWHHADQTGRWNIVAYKAGERMLAETVQ